MDPELQRILRELMAEDPDQARAFALLQVQQGRATQAQVDSIMAQPDSLLAQGDTAVARRIADRRARREEQANRRASGAPQGLERLGLNLWGGLQGLTFNQADDVVSLMGGREWAQGVNARYNELPLGERLTAEFAPDLGLTLATGGLFGPAKAGAKAAAKGVGKLANRFGIGAPGKRIASEEAAGAVTEGLANQGTRVPNLWQRARGWLTGKPPEDLVTGPANQMENISETMAAAGRGDNAAAEAAEGLLKEGGLFHPGSLGINDAAGRTATRSFPMFQGVAENVGQPLWNLWRHGRLKPDLVSDNPLTAKTIGDVFSKDRAKRFIGEGVLYGALEGTGQANYITDSEGLGDAFSKFRGGLFGGSALGAGVGYGVGTASGIGGFAYNRLRHFRRPQTSPEVLGDLLTRETGVQPGSPRLRENLQSETQLQPQVEEARQGFFGPRNSDVQGALRSLDHRGASGIRQEWLGEPAREATQPIRVSGLMALGSELGQRNRDDFGPLEGFFKNWREEAVQSLEKQREDMGHEILGLRRNQPEGYGKAISRLEMDRFKLDKDADELFNLRFGDAPRRSPEGGIRNPKTGEYFEDIPRPAADYAIRRGHEASDPIYDYIERAVQERPESLLGQHAPRIMPESLNRRAVPPDRALGYGEAESLLDRWGGDALTKGFADRLQASATRSDSGFANLMDLKGQLGKANRSVEASKLAKRVLSAGLDEAPVRWDKAMAEYANDPKTQDEFGRHYFEGLRNELSSDPPKARSMFRQLLGRSENARQGMVHVIDNAPQLSHLSRVQKQNLINEIAKTANSEAILSQGANSVVDFLIRRAAGVSTRWSLAGTFNRELGGASGRGVPGRTR
ncbi:hypothetical protein [Candidatus Poriferisocius sp.]|uniref:hypothetical protein n=1 Tax=Candidatus Poriferisocius sp. TaxID=3101276 RepID=UPI003B52FCCA